MAASRATLPHNQLSDMREGGSGGGSAGGGNGARRGRKTAAIGKPKSNRKGNMKRRPFEIEYTRAATTSMRPIAATMRTATPGPLTDQPLKAGNTLAICSRAQSMSSSDAAYENRK